MAKPYTSRRKLLKTLGLAGGAVAIDQTPIGLLVRNIFRGQSYLQANGTQARRYIHMTNSGAPPRWVFDLFLTPYNSNNFIANPLVATKYIANSGRYTDCEYATVLRKGINAPWVWQFDVAGTSGDRPMDALLDNALVIQGIVTSFAHGAAQKNLYVPAGASQSIPALASDASNAVIPGINTGAPNFNFRSLKGSTITQLFGGGNLLQTLLTPYLRDDNPTFLSKRNALKNEIDRVALELSRISNDRDPAAEFLFTAKDSASELIDSAFGDIETFWDAGVLKYESLISQSIDTSKVLPGITDLPIGTLAARDNTYQISSEIVNDPDLRTLIHTGSHIRKMADYFTLTEYIMKNDLSHSISIDMSKMRGLAFNGSTNKSSTFDEHETGKMTSLLINSMYARAYSACLLELMDQLKSQGIFNDTVIDITSEFNRSPRSDGSGSDHAGNGASRLFLSGAIQGPYIIGDTIGASFDGVRPGTWGDGGQLNVSHLAATAATLIGAPSPVTNENSLVNFDGVQFTPNISLAKLL